MASRSRPVPEVVILAVAVLVRVAWLVANGHLALANDPADYQRLAVSLAGGHGFGTTVVAPGGGPTAFRPPLWPVFLAGLYWLVGGHLLVARAVEVVLGVVTAGRRWGPWPWPPSTRRSCWPAARCCRSPSRSPSSWVHCPSPWPPVARPGPCRGCWRRGSPADWTS